MSQKCHSLLRNHRGRQTAQLATLAHDFAGEHVIPEHSHPEDQLIFASHGVMTVRTRQGIWVVPPLRAVWIPAGTPHSVGIGRFRCGRYTSLPSWCGPSPRSVL